MDDSRIPIIAQMGCECLQQINEAMAGTNTAIEDALWLNMKTGAERITVRIATCKRDPKSREKARPFQPTFCPFCGTRYVAAEDGAK